MQVMMVPILHRTQSQLTRKDALQALSILRRYLQDEHGTYACKLELGLVTFGQETQLECSKHMIPTTITDYFGV
jgi:hypothetical protein